MAQNNRRQKNNFRSFERLMTRVILGVLALFILMLASASGGIRWLKWTLSLLVLAMSGLSSFVLVLKQEHRRRRSWWMLASFFGLTVCTLVSLLVGFPAPVI